MRLYIVYILINKQTKKYEKQINKMQQDKSTKLIQKQKHSLEPKQWPNMINEAASHWPSNDNGTTMTTIMEGANY